MVTLWNPADEAADFIFELTYSGGHYDLPVHLEPRATRTFTVSEIVKSGLPDANGNVVPSDVLQGGAKISGSQADNEAILIAMDAGTYNVRKGTCIAYCQTCSGVTSTSVAANPFSVAVGGQNQLSLYETWNTGSQTDLTSASSWTTSNAGLATVGTPGTGTPGLVAGVGAGSPTISVQYPYTDIPLYTNYWCEGSQWICPLYYSGASAGALGNVVSVTINSADVTQDAITVTLAGSTLAGTLVIKLVGNPSQTVYNSSASNGKASYSFNLGSLPAQEFTGISATWSPSGAVASATYTYHIRVLGITTLTQYNTPAENQCTGAQQADTVYNNSCVVTNASLVSGFIFRVTNPAGGTGSGQSNKFGSVSRRHIVRDTLRRRSEASRTSRGH